MPLDTTIPLQIRPPEFENPMNAFARMQQLQGMQQQNALNQLTMQEKQRAIQENEAMNAAFSGAMKPDGSLDKQKLFGNVVSANLGSKLPAVQKMLSDQEKSTLETHKLKIENAQKQLQGMASLFNGVTDQGSYDNAKALGERMFGTEAVSHLPVMYNPIDIKNRQAQALTIAEQLTNQKNQLDHQLKLDEFSYKKTNDAANRNVTLRGQNMVDARAREHLNVLREGKVPQGYRARTDGSLEAIPGGPADKIGEKQTSQIIGVNNLLDGIKTYQEQLQKFSLLGYMSPSDRAKMGTFYNNVMLQAKEAYNLGVLNGPDYQIMTDMITDPRSAKGLILSREDMKAQTDALADIMKNVGGNAAQRRPLPSNVQAPFVSQANMIPTGQPSIDVLMSPEIRALVKQYATPQR